MSCKLEDCMLMSTSNQSILIPDSISHLRGYSCGVEQVNGNGIEGATCVLKASAGSSYLCAKSKLRVASKLSLCLGPFDS